MECLFCAIVNKKIPSKIVYEDNICVVVLDIAPASLGHMLVIPRKHYETSFHIPDDEYEHIMNVARKAAMVVMKVNKCLGVNIIDRIGEYAGQKFPHATIHVIPRYKDDKIMIGWQPKKVDEGILDGLASKFKPIFSSLNIKVKKKVVEVKKSKEEIKVKKKDKKEVIYLKPKIPKP